MLFKTRMLGMRSVLPLQQVSHFLYSVRSHSCDVPAGGPVTGRGFGKIGKALFRARNGMMGLPTVYQAGF